MKIRMLRREFIKLAVSFSALLFFGDGLKHLFAKPSSSNGRPKKRIKGAHDLVAVEGEDPYAITVEAVKKIGGMGRFVKKNNVVVIKPNMAWDRTPEQAANTNPLVMAALVDLCFEAGAKRVNVFDIPCNDARRSYANSGIEKAVKERGAKVYFADTWNTIKAKFDYDSPMRDWPILKDALECDTFINVPVLKHHSLARLTISMKNLMGVCTGNRSTIHQDMGRKLVDLTDFVKPDLTVIDAFRVLVRNGPTGGNLKDVVFKKTVFASVDTTLAELYACDLLDVNPQEVPNLKYAIERNFGITDIKKADILKIKA